MAEKPYRVDIDLMGNEIKNFLIHRLSTAPANPVAGQMYYDTTIKKIRYWDGTEWINGSKLIPENKVADTTGNYGTFSNVSGDKWLFRNIKAKSSKILVTLSANGEIEIDANITKTDVGLGNVTNDAQVKRSEMGATNGVATLGADGKVPATQLPSYVDDVVEFEAQIPTKTGMTVGKLYYITGTKLLCSATSATAGTDITPEAGKIYVDLQTSKTYRWGGTDLVVISETLALGETSSSAYRGDRGKIAYDHAMNADGMGAPHVSDAERTAWNAKQGTSVTITDPVATSTIPSAGSHGIAALFQTVLGLIKELFGRFNASTGHDHNGTNSKKIDYSSLTGTGSIVKRYVSAVLTGQTGTITAATHGCGQMPQVVFLQNGVSVELSWMVNASGDITWSSNYSFIAGDALKAVVQGI